MKILNLYSGIGGNRKLWTPNGDDHDITAVEYKQEIADIYHDFFPNDTIVVADAHQYLLDHYKEYDFIWSSPPCPTHSRMNFLLKEKGKDMVYPDMKLYEEIIFLKTFFKGNWAVENVKSYYDPLIFPYTSGRHYFWSSNYISDMKITKKVRNDKGMTLEVKMNQMGIIIKDFHNYKGDKRTLINNCIEPELGEHILNCALGEQAQKPLL